MSRRQTTNMSPALAGSLILHVGLFVLVMVLGLYFKAPPSLPGGVPITIVSDGPPNLRQAEQGDVEEVSEGEDLQAEPLPEPLPVAPPDPATKPAKPLAKPPPTPSPKRKADLDFDRLLADVQGARAPARARTGGGGGTARRDRTLAVGASTGPSAGAKGYLLTLGTDLGRRWTPNCLVEGGADVNIKVSFIVSSNGRLLADPVSSGKDAPPGSLIRAGSDAAVRAIRMTEPFPNFPPELYGEKITVNFNANQVCANR